MSLRTLYQIQLPATKFCHCSHRREEKKTTPVANELSHIFGSAISKAIRVSVDGYVPIAYLLPYVTWRYTYRCMCAHTECTHICTNNGPIQEHITATVPYGSLYAPVNDEHSSEWDQSDWLADRYLHFCGQVCLCSLPRASPGDSRPENTEGWLPAPATRRTVQTGDEKSSSLDNRVPLAGPLFPKTSTLWRDRSILN